MKKNFYIILGISVSLLCSQLAFAGDDIQEVVTSQSDIQTKISDDKNNEFTEEENVQILNKEREERKNELSKTRKITDEMYAAFFGWDSGDISADVSVDYANNHFLDMGYLTEPFKTPTYLDILRRYYCTDILLFGGHGEYDRVYVRPAPYDRTSDNDTGVYMGTRNFDEGSTTRLVGIGAKSLSQSRFIMYAACLTASANYPQNIVQYSVVKGAQSALGFRLLVNSTNLNKWENSFLNYVSSGQTLSQARNNANNEFKSEADTGILSSAIEGDGNIRLSKNRSRSNADEAFTYISDTLQIDCANNELQELTKFLDKNVDGFDSDTCQIELINHTGPSEDDYTILYGLQVNGFKTPYKVLVIVGDDDIMYSSNLNEFNQSNRSNLLDSNEISEEVIDIAKSEALAKTKVNEGTTVESQEVTKQLDENLKPYLYVQTGYADKDGGTFAEGYDYYLD